MVWYSFKLGEDPEAYGQRIAANGTEIGGDIRLTTTGTATDDKKVYDPAIAYNPLAGNYLLTYERNEPAPNPALSEVYSQVLSATAVLQGSPLRLSAVGKRATEPRASYATSGGGAGQHLVVWAQDSPPPGFADSEIWGRRIKLRRDRPGGSVPALRQRGGVHHAADGRRAQRRHRMALGVVLGLPERRRHPPAGRRGHGPPGRRGHDPERRRRLQAAGSRPRPRRPPRPRHPLRAATARRPVATAPPPVVQPPAAAPPKLKAKDVLRLPSTKKCVSRRKFRIRLRTPKGTRIVRATVKLNGKRFKTVKGKRLTAAVDLRGLPKGRFKVAIEIRTADGRKVTATRRYRTCAPKRKQ